MTGNRKREAAVVALALIAMMIGVVAAVGGFEMQEIKVWVWAAFLIESIAFAVKWLCPGILFMVILYLLLDILSQWVAKRESDSGDDQ